MTAKVGRAVTKVAKVAKVAKTCEERWRLVNSRRRSNSSPQIQSSKSEDFSSGRKEQMYITFRTKRTPKYASMVKEIPCALRLALTAKKILKEQLIWSRI